MTNTQSRVLVTNDDGIGAPGLHRLAAAAAAAGYDVVVAAPQREASGMGAALTAVVDEGRVRLERTSVPGLPDVPAFAVAASPGYIAVLAGLGAFGPVPDLVLSGINRGANTGYGILHSGTVGAALTAANGGISALAVSLDVHSGFSVGSADGGAAIAEPDQGSRHWDTAAELAGRFLPWLGSAPAGTVLNLNVPDVPASELAGVREAELARFGEVQLAVAETGADFVRTAIAESRVDLVPGTDLAWLADGYAAVTAIRSVSAVTGLSVQLD